jgi:hypothetical protein
MNDDQSRNLHERIDQLERKLAVTRKLAVGVIVIVAVMSFMPQQDTVSARAFLLRNASGHILARLGTDRAGSPFLQFFDREQAATLSDTSNFVTAASLSVGIALGDPTLRLEADGRETEISSGFAYLSGRSGTFQLDLVPTGTSPAVQILDPSRHARLLFSADSTLTRFVLNGVPGTSSATFLAHRDGTLLYFADPGGAQRVSVGHTRAGGVLTFLNADGTIRAAFP